MTATGVVAIVGAVSTPVVALAGFVYNHVRGKEDRADARALATDAQQHDLEVRRRERAYEARKEAYTNVLQWALVMVQQVQLTDPILTHAGMPGPPDDPPRGCSTG